MTWRDGCTCIMPGTDRDYWAGSLCEACEREMEEEAAQADADALEDERDEAFDALLRDRDYIVAMGGDPGPTYEDIFGEETSDEVSST